jgi:autotransporter translocation and assembly factor TamB
MALGWVADWIDFIDWSQGEMSVNTNVILSRGELKGIRGTGNISNGVVDFAFLNERMQDLSGSFRLLDEGVLFEGLEGKLGDGAITIGGRVGYPWMSPSKMDLTLDFREIRIKPYTDLSLILSGKLNLEGTQTPYKVKGHVNVLRADIAGDHFSEELSNREIESRFVPREFQKGRGEVFALDVGISIPSKFRVESRVFTGDLKGDFRLQGTDSNPVVLGNLSITSGDLAIRDNRFVIDSGNLRFENTNRVDPLLNVSTHMDIVSEERKYRVYLNILGAWSYPQLEYSSDPPLSPEDITSLVVFGVTTQQFEEKEGQSVSQELVPQLFARSGVSRTLEKKTGLKVQLDSYYNSTKEGTTLPRISVSRRVGKDVNVKFISNIDQETYREFNVEYQLNNNVSLKGLWEGRSAAASTTTSTPTAQTDDVKNSFGGDIQFKFEFE